MFVPVVGVLRVKLSKYLKEGIMRAREEPEAELLELCKSKVQGQVE